MMRWNCAVILSSLVLTLSASGLGAQPEKAAPPNPEPAKPVSLALDATAVPPDFQGDPIEEVYKAWTPAPKGEFETTEQYQKRAAPPDPNRLYFFYDSVFPEYDADTQEFVIKINLWGTVYDGPKELYGQGQASRLKSIDTKRETYTASNAFGATTKVTRTETDSYLIASSRFIVGNAKEGPMKSEALRVRVPIEEAPALKKRLGMIWVCRSRGGSETPTVAGYTSEKPTLQRPYETRVNHYTLRVHTLSLWVFDKETGRILQKFDQTMMKK